MPLKNTKSPGWHPKTKYKNLRVRNGVGKQGCSNQPPIDDTDPIQKLSIDPGSPTDLQTQQNSLQKGSRYGISVSTPHCRYGHRLRTPFLRTPSPRLLKKLVTFGPSLYFGCIFFVFSGGQHGVGNFILLIFSYLRIRQWVSLLSDVPVAKVTAPESSPSNAKDLVHL